MSLQDRSILVVEDDPILRRFIGDVLKRKGCQVASAADGLAGLEEIKKHPYHLVVSDLKMAGMDGLELLTRIKKISPATEVIIITAFGSVSTAVDAMKKGAFDYITKPVELEELDIVIERVFQHQKLLDENRFLKQELNKNSTVSQIIGRSTSSQRVKELIDMVGPLSSTVLIMGETGTGKEVAASALRQVSPRRDKPFIKVNCAALPESLLENELFGHEKGAFTGAVQRTKGRFELADGGTLLLDEIGELDLHVQAKLLRVLQHQEFERVGSGKTVKVDVRVIATTNRNLKDEVKKGNFRKDLFFRLNVVSLTLTSLRDRREDIPHFLTHFLDSYNKKYDKNKSFSNKALELLIQYDWPGNVRELENSVETAVILNREDILKPEHFLFLEDHRDLLEDENGFREDMTIAEVEKQLIIRTYRRMNFNKTQTAKKLGITIKTLRTKLRDYEIIDKAVQDQK
ncbi:sigma-54-dependent Fis family transcriptional regulator [bacterium]|nr:sigma-54-dependent Fis family transcriptional regulator [bacterium]